MVEDAKISNEVLQRIIKDLKNDPTIKRIYILLIKIVTYIMKYMKDYIHLQYYMTLLPMFLVFLH